MCSGGVRGLGLEEKLFLYLAFYFSVVLTHTYYSPDIIHVQKSVFWLLRPES